MRDLVDGPYAPYERLHVVLDNLSTHTPAAFYEAFAPEEARRVLRKLEFHYVPKHASWLNMVEIEIGVLASQCPSHSRSRHPDHGSRCLGSRAQRGERDRDVDVWDRPGAPQAGTCLPDSDVARNVAA
jgi:hypothetical protein